jgi:hypothetical protein
VSTIEELLGRKDSGSGLENTAVGIRHADHVATYIRKSWHQLGQQAAVARSVQFARGLRPRNLVLHVLLPASGLNGLDGWAWISGRARHFSDRPWDPPLLLSSGQVGG